MAVSGLVSAVIVGLIIGSLARMVVPDRPAIPIWLTIMIGLLAATVGTLIANAFGVASTSGTDWVELVIQLGLAAIAIATYVSIARPERRLGPAPAPRPTPGGPRPVN